MTEGDGGFPGPNFYARPVVGAHFAFLALERACDGDGDEHRRENEEDYEDENDEEDAHVELVERDDEL